MEDLEERFESWDDPMEVPFTGFTYGQNTPIKAVTEAPGKHLQMVKLIIGSNDVLFTVDDMKKLMKSALVDKSVYVVENPDRKDNFQIDMAAYGKVISDFLGT